MYIQKIHIKNYRNFNDFEMEFHEGLNVIVGANNSGKTGLLHAINALNDATITVDDFNKNNLIQFEKLYKDNAPAIEIVYYIKHIISIDDISDESIIKLIPFLGFKGIGDARTTDEGKTNYNVTAVIKSVYSLDVKYIEEYRKAVAPIKTFDEYFIVLNRFVSEHYDWNYTNGTGSDTKATSKDARGVFDIRFIGAERTSEEVSREAKREIDAFSKKLENATELDKFKSDTSAELKKLLSPSLNKLSELFESEQNDIGLKKGNVSISPSIRANFSIPDSFVTEVKDTKTDYIVPLSYNGLGYNNLINIYMLIRLNKIKVGKEFRILCLEEPEAHLHPAMQYKLFKYLKKLDTDNELKQQIFVTTHSSNISAVAGLDNMFMMAYDRTLIPQDCVNQSLSALFDISGEKADENELKEKREAKKHLSKFLDVTRSDILFADKVILVEGIAERLLMPRFMEKCGYAYEDEHISIIEIGGKHFEYFIELFNGNALKKKVLCITDNDFDWCYENVGFDSKENYIKEIPSHIKKIKSRFTFDEFKLCTQINGGRTFEDELFLSNFDKKETAIALLKVALPEVLHPFIDDYGLDINKWQSHIQDIDGRSKKTINKFLNLYNNRIDKDKVSDEWYQRLFFAELFLHYASNNKGDIALAILSDFADKDIVVPSYICEGIEWLK